MLYGSTQRTYLLSEAISQSLIEICSRKPSAILTDLVELWELSRWARMPVAWVPPESTMLSSDRSQLPNEHFFPFEISGQQIRIAASDQNRLPELEAAIASFAMRLPLAEPFQRIQLAIAEAQSSARWRESA